MTSTPSSHRVPWAAVIVFVLLACGLAWLAQLPQWLGDGLASPLFHPMTMVMMFTPTIAALIVMLTMVRPSHKARYLGLTPFRPVARKLWLIVLAPFVWLAIAVGALGIAIALGWAEGIWTVMDLTEPQADGRTALDAIISIAITLPLGILATAVATFGEELGWRGFLTTALAPLGFWPSALIIGVVWGAWHAPIIMLGYNYGRTDITGVLWMIGFCIALGVLQQWTRYWTRNVWPAVIGHAVVNTVSGPVVLFLAPGSDPALSTVLGVSGWIAMGVVVALLAVTGLLGRRLPTPLVPMPADAEPLEAAPADADAPVEVGSYGQARATSASDQQPPATRS